MAGAAVTVGAALLLAASLPEAGTRVLKACTADPVEVEAELEEAVTEPDADDEVTEPVAETVVDPDADVDEVWEACALETTLDA